MTEISGKAAVVTGGGSGIGMGLAKELARQGATVAVADIILDNARKLKSFVAGLSYENFLSDEKTQYAVMRAAEIIGEATNACLTNSANVIRRFPGARWRHARHSYSSIQGREPPGPLRHRNTENRCRDRTPPGYHRGARSGKSAPEKSALTPSRGGDRRVRSAPRPRRSRE